MQLGETIVRIESKDIGRRVNQLDADDFSQLQKSLYIAKDCKVMLTNNILPELGLYNSAMGTVREILYAEDVYPPELPQAVVIELDKCDIPDELCYKKKPN